MAHNENESQKQPNQGVSPIPEANADGKCRQHSGNSEVATLPRRTFIGTAGTLAMGCGVAAGYGTFGYCALRFLQPGEATENLGWQFVTHLNDLTDKNSYSYETSSGIKLVLARQPDSAIGFIALSSVCPHLGCQVFWEPANSRFFCPCHNGAFDSSGKATEGPPKAAKQSLKQYGLKVENDLVYVLAPMRNVTENSGQEGNEA
ncbi:MAG: Rieske (2Fe-2S) protein [Pirellulaceae bacterium]